MLIDELGSWMRAERARLSRHSEVAKAFYYMLTRWPAFTVVLGDGQICLTNNASVWGVAWHRPATQDPGCARAPIVVANAPPSSTA